MTDHNRLRELAQRATPGPWRMDHPHDLPFNDTIRSDDGWLIAKCWPSSESGSEASNAQLILEAVNALPALLDENDRLREALQLAAETYHEETHPSLGPANECAVWPCNPAARAALESSEPTNRVLTDDGLVAGESSGGPE